MDVLALIGSALFLGFVALLTYWDHRNPDSWKTTVYHEKGSVATRKRKLKQIRELNAQVADLNQKHPEREFYRDNGDIREKPPEQVARERALQAECDALNAQQPDGLLHYEIAHGQVSPVSAENLHIQRQRRDLQYYCQANLGAGVELDYQDNWKLKDKRTGEEVFWDPDTQAQEYPLIVLALADGDPSRITCYDHGYDISPIHNIPESFFYQGFDLDELMEEHARDLYALMGLFSRHTQNYILDGAVECDDTGHYEVSVWSPDYAMYTEEHIEAEIKAIGSLPHFEILQGFRPERGPALRENQIHWLKNGDCEVVIHAETCPTWRSQEDRIPMSAERITRALKARFYNVIDVSNIRLCPERREYRAIVSGLRVAPED